MATKASIAIPFIPRLFLLSLEPVFALGGVLMAFTKPGDYLATLTREALPKIQPGTQFVYTQLAGGWLHFAFTEAVVLRLVDDMRVWRLLCTGMLLSDFAYLHSTAEAVGGWSVYARVGEWTTADWVVTITTVPFVLTRIAVVLGVWGGGAIKRE